jgi:hypothetical protein
MKLSEYAKRFRVEDGSEFRLKDFDPAETLGLKSKERAHEILEQGIHSLCDLQEKLFAQDRWAILVARVQCKFIQGAFDRGTGARFSVEGRTRAP